MSFNKPFIGRVWISPWVNKRTQEKTMGIKLGGLNGVVAHLDKNEAYELANTLVDLADTLPDAPLARYGEPSAPVTPSYVQLPVHTTRSLTSACGDNEPELPTSTLELE